jgi:hypothetical protein
MSIDLILIVLAVVFGIAYFAKRNHRRQSDLKAQDRRGR